MKPGKAKRKVTWNIATNSLVGAAVTGTAMTTFIYFVSAGSKMWGYDPDDPTCLELRKDFNLPCPDSEQTPGRFEFDPNTVPGDDVRPPFGTPDWFTSTEGVLATFFVTLISYAAISTIKAWPKRRGYEGAAHA